jgi:uncharacterized protein YgiM (DUF1202 family)
VTQFAPDSARAFLLLTCILMLAQNTAHADVFDRFFGDDRPIEVRIADPYIEMRSGPGRGYPVFHVEERGAWIEVLKRKTDWFKIRTGSGKEGWVARHQIERTLTPAGDRAEIRDATMQEFAQHRWEMGLMGGDFEGADVMTLYGGFSFTPNLSIEASLSRAFADFSDADMGDVSLAIHPFPNRRFSPFFSIGTGVIRSDAKTTLVQEPDSTDQLAHVGVGIRIYLARRFLFRAQYKNYVIFQSTDDNQEIDEWKAGFSVFF